MRKYAAPAKNECVKVLLLAALIVLFNLPFINRAVAVDDVYVAAIAENIIKNPFDPYGFEWHLQNKPLQSAFNYTSPPLVSYFMALAKLIFDNEAFLHLSFMLFSIIAGVSMFYISKRFIKYPLISSILMVAAPVFSVASNNFMHDVPVLALAMSSLLLFIIGVDKGRKLVLALSGILYGLSFLTKYNAVILLPVLLFYSFLRKKPRYMLFLLFALIPVFAWSANELYHYGAVHSMSFFLGWYTVEGISSNLPDFLFRTIIPHFIANLSYIGGATIFFVFLVFPFARKKRDIALLLLIILLGSAMAGLLYLKSAGFMSGQYSIPQLALLVIFVASSSFFLFKAAEAALKALYSLFIKKKGKAKDMEKAFLGFWLFSGLAFHTILAGGNARYLTIILPPLVLLYFILLEDASKQHKIKNNVITAILAINIVFTSALGLAAGFADYQYAETYRDFAYKMPGNASGSTIFFTGHEGFKHYMEKRGFVFFHPETSELKGGDIIIAPKIPVPRSLDEIKGRLELVDKKAYYSNFPLRINNPWSHAGFYTYANGFLPYSVSYAPLDVFYTYKVRGG